MHAKFLNFTLLFATFSIHAALPQAWEGAHYGECFKTFEAGMSTVYGESYASDDNIVSQSVNFGTTKMSITADTTSGTNSPRTIFEKTKSGWCVVLASPPVSQIHQIPHQTSNAKPKQWETLDQAPAGMPETKVIYEWSSKDNFYAPQHCYSGSHEKWKEFSCSDAYK